MWKRYLRLILWIIAAAVGVMRIISHLQSGASKGRIAVDVLLIVLFLMNIVDAYRRLHIEKKTNAET